MSAGLSLAVASPLLDGDAESSHMSSGYNSVAGDFSGIWRSHYVYSSTSRKSELVGEHYVALRQNGSRLTGQSVAHTTGSQLRLELFLDALVATGTWREVTSPTGYYKGATYHGTLQMVIDPGGHRMRGMWLGFGRDFTINSGEWELTWQESSVAKNTQRTYQLKL